MSFQRTKHTCWQHRSSFLEHVTKFCGGYLDNAPYFFPLSFALLCRATYYRCHLTISLPVRHNSIRANDITLFYFSGHGGMLNTRNYLLSSDAKQCKDGVNLESEVVSKLLEAARNQIVVVLLDSCRVSFDDPFSGGIDKLSPQMERNTESDLRVFFGCDPGRFALESPTGGNYFTKALLEHIKDKRGFEYVVKAVTASVLNRSGNRQRPLAEHSGEQNFSLAGKK